VASAFSHVIVATAVGKLVQPQGAPWWYWFAGATLSVLPDLDVIGFGFGIRYQDLLGHRGLSHSLFTAVLFAGVISLAWPKQNVISMSRLFVFLLLAMASHGVLDAMTNGGLGVAFFSPFNNARYFFPFTPIEVSPIGVGRFFSQRGIAVIVSEVKWLWLPSAALVALAILVRRLKGSHAA